MTDENRIRRDNEPGPIGGAGVRVPAPGESSSAELPAIKRPDLRPEDRKEPGRDARTKDARLDSDDFDAPTQLNIPSLPRISGDAFSGARSYTPPQSRVDSTSRAGGGHVDDSDLAPGTLLGNRYEILEMVGIGGMGAVYKAKDVELNRMVALKVIRPEFARDPAIISRFKQELILATQVTHKNVIRIYDLGEASGLRFITMEYIEGRDLRAILREKGKFTPEEAISVIRQVCRALRAAHAVGVIHRDLKPPNIMCEPSGRILVMDFGLARTLEDNGMTQSGSMVGTMEYMSPEQALAGDIDQRSDLFALGIIFYELLSGATPFQAGSAVASLILRTQKQVVSLSDLDPSIPKPLSDIVCRLLERDVNKRYQTANDLLSDLDAYEGKGTGASLAATAIRPIPDALIETPSETKDFAPKRKLSWPIIAALGLCVVLLAGFGIYRWRSPAAKQQVASGPILSLAVLPLRNTTGDPGLDSMGATLSDMLITAVGQSAHLRTVSPERLQQVYSDLQLKPTSTIDPDMLGRIAEAVTAEEVVAGQFSRDINGDLTIDVKVQDIKSGHTVPLKAQFSEKNQSAAIAELADSVRKNLSLSTDDIEQVKAQSYVPQSTSAEALRDYNEAATFMRAGRSLDALKRLQAAIAADSQFALAYARLGEVQADLGYQGDAEEASRRAVELAENEKLPAAAKYLIAASHARVMQENAKAIEYYENLARNLTGDTDVQYALGDLYVQTGAYDKARVQFERILKAEPKNILALWQMGIISLTSNNPQTALDPLNTALSLAIRTDNQQAKGLLLLSIGITYRLLNKPEDAIDNYQQSIAIDERLGQKRAVAAALDEMAQVQASTGKSEEAVKSYKRSLDLLREIGMKKELGDTLLNLGVVLADRGQSDQALQAYQDALQVERETGDQNLEAMCLSNIATIYVKRGDTGGAFTYYQQALQLREKLGVPGFIADTLAGMGDAYSANGQYEEALKSYLRALDLFRKAGDQRGAAVVSSQMGTVFKQQGRFGAAVNASQDAVRNLQALGQRSNEFADAENGLARALADAGRGSEARVPLDDAEKIALELKNDNLLADIANTSGVIALYSGDLKSAGQQFQKALQLARVHSSVPMTALSQLHLARVAIAEGRAKEAVAILSPIVASRSPIDRSLALRASLALSDALIQTRALPRARLALLSDLGTAERAGMRLELVRANFLLARIAKSSGNADASASYYRQALEGLVSLRNEDGGGKLLDRVDLKAISEECIHATAPATATK
jgi:serine/threonine protein kinase/tetratricopeptide (TPR) repeat protein